jgi:two-component system CheB/CheR fusion protein
MLERTLAFEFKGKTQLAYHPSGVHCSIAIPLSRRVVHSPALDN